MGKSQLVNDDHDPTSAEIGADRRLRTKLDAQAQEGQPLPDDYVVVAADDGTDVHPLQSDASGNLKVNVAAGSAAGTEYTEDAAAAANPDGGVNMLIRDDTPGTLVSTDGDNVAQRGTNYGAAFSQIVDSSGNFVDSFGGSGGTAAADDADFVAGTTQGTPVMGVFESSPTSVTDNDMGIVGMSATRRLHVDADITAQSLANLEVGTVDTVTAVTDITNTIDSTISGAALTALELIDDTVAVLGTATYSEAATKGLVAGAVRNDVLAALADTDNEIAPLQVGDLGALWVDQAPNVVDSGNSSVATLGIDAVFTGTGVDVLGYGGITIQVDSSHNSATDGMTFQFSIDNTNWDDINLFTYTAANGARRFQFGTTGQFFRVVYTNGGTGQTHFRMETVLHHVLTPLTSIHRISADTNPDRSSTLVKSALIAQKAGSGDFVPVQSTAGGNLKVSVEEMSDGLDIGAGNAGTETQRVSIATDDVNLSAIKTAVEKIDDVVHVEDVQHSTGDSGVMMLGVENADGAALTAGDKDYTPIATTAEGYVIVSGSTDAAAGPLNVDITSGAINGPGDPTIDSITQFAINLNAGANQVLVSSAANKQIWVYAVAFTCSVAGTVSFQDELDVAVTGIMDFAANSGLALSASGNFAMPLWKLGTDKDLEVDVVTAAIDGFLTYALVSV